MAVKSQDLNIQQIETSLGNISVQVKEVAGTIPVIFLHGIYFDHELWNYQAIKITNRSVITLDMPLHGNSKRIYKKDWTVDDCAKMLIEILETLKIEKVIAIGHSWGSMTILMAANIAPDRFQSIGFCNMPFHAATKKMNRQFKMQHLLLDFKRFYIKQVAKSMYGKETLEKNPELLNYLFSTMRNLTKKEIRQIDEAIILKAKDTEAIIKSLKVPAIALIGKEDYVPKSAYLETQIINGGHVSPIESPHEVYNFVLEVIELK